MNLNCLPNEIALSTKASSKFSSIKQRVGISPNIMARIAILKALEQNIAPSNLDQPESLQQRIPRDIAFGDFQDFFDFGIQEYIDSHSYSGDVKELITCLIETGSSKIGNIKKYQDLQTLF